MTLKKKEYDADEEAIFDEAIIYKRGDYWHFRMWLAKERKYARLSLKTRSKSTAIDRAKQRFYELMAQQLAGKSYFSKNAKDGVEEYLGQRQKDVDAGIIVKGRYGTIKTHLGHWLDFIGRDTKLKELERTDCENYFHERTKTKRGLAISQTTVLNEQSTINAMMSWLYKNKETYIEAFDFKKLPRIDRGDDANRRASFTDDEILDIQRVLEGGLVEARKQIDDEDGLTRYIVGHYLLLSIETGLRRGEQLQLRWRDITWLDRNIGGIDRSLVKITVRGETSKVRKTRTFAIEDREYFDGLFKLLQPRYIKVHKGERDAPVFAETLIFSVDGKSPITVRSIDYHFRKALEQANIRNVEKRDLVPYSFRHYFITKKVNSGLLPQQVAEMCGTSTAQIDRTYYHTTEERMITNALAGYIYKDGLLIPKQSA
ncbi:tyrosine-type recombinase/integrase [Leptothrix discophora]|uniref:Tyrosine-type recombinase/integrase n=1 Tax=Leptothrix discophora TaxID=89 RepID=A0ABT9G153_LEPDI|nr:tyrosine-type recombinase/integrase [Leptothrix discophora]MDP4300219.1 tyrosine-type recombinase/integrase [Leptothrix discophora]